MKVYWTRNAIGQLTSIYEHIAQESPRYALRMVDRITARSQQIDAHPRSGQMVPEYQDSAIREVIEGPYRVIYLLGGDIRVLAVVHGAQLLPSDPPVEAPE